MGALRDEPASARSADGTEIAFAVHGSGPPVVLVHGLTGSGASWAPVVERLAAEHTCVTLDLRGHGASGSAEAYGLPWLVADVRAVVEALGLDRPVVVGHSLGGTVAALYAGAHEVRAVAVVDQGLRFGDVARWLQARAAQLDGPGALDVVLELDRELGFDHPAGWEAFERRVRAFDPEVVRGVWATALTTPPDELTALAEQVLPRIGAPLLALHGPAPAPDYADWLTRLVPWATVEVWAGVGHFPHLTDPDRFAGRVRALARDAR